MARPRVPAALGAYVAVVALPALVIATVSVAGAAVTVTNARDARAFEQRATIVSGTVVREIPATAVDGDALEIRLDDPPPVTVVVGTADRGAYETGDPVEVRIDPADPTRARLVTEPYDLAGALTFWVVLLGASLAATGYRLWRARHLMRLAASSGQAWQCHGRALKRRSWRGEQRWLLLEALDDRSGRPVAGLPLLGGQRPLPAAEQFAVLVKGDLRHGGTAVAEVDGVTYWPAGKVEVPGPSPDP